MKKLLLLTLLSIAILNAKVIEVEQLFNRTTTKVKQENFSQKSSFYGNFMVDESKTIDIISRFDGYITKLNANKTFMSIKKDKTLFSIYSEKVLSIKNELQVAKKINTSLYKSAKNKLIALDIHPKELKKLQSNSLEKDINFYSPTNSIVLKKMINKGSFVKKGALLLQLANIDKLWFIASVYQKDLSFIKQNQEAKIYVDGIKQPVKSKVDFIYPIVDKTTKTVDVRFIVNNKKLTLFPNMFAKVVIAHNKQTMLTLPKSAVLNKGSKTYVFRPLSDSEFEPVLVEVKRISSNKYQIIDGLKADEEVINNALFLLDSDAVTNALYDDEDTDW